MMNNTNISLNNAYVAGDMITAILDSFGDAGISILCIALDQHFANMGKSVSEAVAIHDAINKAAKECYNMMGLPPKKDLGELKISQKEVM